MSPHPKYRVREVSFQETSGHRAPLLFSWGDRERQGLEQEELQGVAGGLRVARRTGPLKVWLGRVAGFLE